MSLINQMLRDLDKRHGLSESETLPESVRAAAPLEPNRRPGGKGLPILGLAVGGMLFLGIAARVYWLSDESAVPQPRPVNAPEIKPAPLVAETPIEAPLDVPTAVAASPEPVARPVPPVAVQSTPGPATQPDAPRLRAATALTQPVSRTGKVEKQAVADDPDERIALKYRQALSQLNKGQVREAMESLYAIVRERPEHLTAWQVLVRLLLEQSRPDEAIRVLSEANSQSGSLTIVMQLARLQAEYGTDAQALLTLQAAHKAGQNNPDYHGFLANLLQRQKQPADAAGEYRRALALRPTEGRWWIGLGLCLEAQGQAQEAKAAWRRGLQLNTLPADLRQFAESKLSEG